MSKDWRKDPAWRIASYDKTFYPNGAPEKPTKDAELSQDGMFCDQYERHRPVATWTRG